MTRFPKKLQDKLVFREEQKTLRRLPEANVLVDLSSNDYLGLSRNKNVFQRASQLVSQSGVSQNGATGSRLLSGNHFLYSELEEMLSGFHRSESALVFNSGYDANIGFFGSVPQRGDIVFYDELIHASIRDGIKMGNAKSYKFKHNDVADLERKCRALGHRYVEREADSPESNASDAGESKKVGIRLPGLINEKKEAVPLSLTSSVKKPAPGAVEIYVITESVFSMDGDSPDLKAFAGFCQEMNYHLVVDEAHAVGVFGKRGEGLVQDLELQDAVFARIVTFGKALGCHGAAILGSQQLKDYLINFARSLVYTTGLPPHSVATILTAYEFLSAPKDSGDATVKYPIENLLYNIKIFNDKLERSAVSTVNGSKSSAGSKQPSEVETSGFGNGSTSYFIPSTSAIHCCILPGNERVLTISEKLREHGFDVKAILSPTVPQGHERLRICLHSFNTKKEINTVLDILSTYI